MPADFEGCGNYRLLQAGELAAADGVDFSVAIDLPLVKRKGVVVGVVHPDVDVIVLQRPLVGTVVDAIPLLQEAGVAVVVDVDDDWCHLSPIHLASKLYDPNVNEKVSWAHLLRAIKMADVLTVSTDRLREHYRDDAIVLPNLIPERLLGISAVREGRVIGWAGFTETHPGDLGVTQGGVEDAMRRSSWHFRLIGGEGRMVEYALGVEVEDVGPMDFGAYPHHVAKLDIAIAPLLNNACNLGKSPLRLLEAGALGVPTVATPTPEYAATHIGLFASTQAQWARMLKSLMNDDEYRLDVGERSRQRVIDHYLLGPRAHLWPEAWQRAIDVRRGARRAKELIA